ncbi:MAG: response regulator [Clostridia bacterium]|nr:response regulator [Clostridia bacterium]
MEQNQMSPESFPTAKILIVDDYPGNIDILCQALPESYELRTALSGLEALDLLQRTTFLPDLILLDVMMPDLDGYEVCRILKQDARFREIPVIFVSAVADVQSKINGLKIGGVDYITKPYNFREVQARIDIHLKLRHLNQTVTESNRQLEALVETKIQAISDTQLELIFALSNLVTLRDPSTGGHIERVRDVIQILAQALAQDPRYSGLVDARYMDQLIKASSLHDIGKISVPDRILGKTAPLNEQEAAILAEHTQIGAATLAEVSARFPGNSFIDMGIDMTHSHHERWDGTGYPDGLKGDAIPLSAQILALADTLDYRYAEALGGKACLSPIEMDQPFPPATAGSADAIRNVRAWIEAEKGRAFSSSLVETYQTVADNIENLYMPAGTSFLRPSPIKET